MLDPAFLKMILDMGAWALALMSLGWMYIHVRDYQALLNRVTELEAEVLKQKSFDQDQRVTNAEMVGELKMIDQHQEEFREELRLMSRVMTQLQVQIATHFIPEAE